MCCKILDSQSVPELLLNNIGCNKLQENNVLSSLPSRKSVLFQDNKGKILSLNKMRKIKTQVNIIYNIFRMVVKLLIIQKIT